jgi:methylated-DNA-[protein]-cysteine S-methyltransferase
LGWDVRKIRIDPIARVLVALVSMSRDAMSQAVQSYLVFEVLGGFCGIAWSSRGITRLCLPTSSAQAATRMLLQRVPGAVPGTPTPEVAEAVTDVQRYFTGARVDFSRFGLELTSQGELNQRIYQAARRLAWGQTTTYGSLAKELGAGPEAARDVGQAMAQNPVPLIIPCHRVLAAGGRVGGFSAPGGASTKIRMLELEGVRIDTQRSPQQSLF